MSPTYKMPDEVTRRRVAILEDVEGALAAARCVVTLAGMGTDEFVVRELLLTGIQQLDHATAAVRRLV